MGRHVFYTKITPLPSNIPRLLALDLLHSHDEFIRLNPLVVDCKPCEAPRNAEGDEYFSNWFEIFEITKIAGVKKKIQFKGCFHSQSWGLKTHVFAPLGLEFRNSYRIGGNQPGEPREDRELGVNTPEEGLYLREDISFTCNALMASYVKKEMEDASQVMINRMKRKAELLDEGKLHAMFENGMLKTSKPRQPPPAPIVQGETTAPSPTSSLPGSPHPQSESSSSPNPQQSDSLNPGFQNYNSLAGRQNRPESYVPYQLLGYAESDRSSRAISDRPTSEISQQPGSGQPEKGGFVSELPGSYYHAQQQTNNSFVPPAVKQGGPMSFRSELPGDYYHSSPPTVHPAYQQQSSPQPSPGLSAPDTQAGAQRLSAAPSQLGNSYQVINLEDSQQSQRQDWQRSVQNDPPINENHYRNSRNSHGMGAVNRGGSSSSTYSNEPDHQRMSNLSIQPQQSHDRDSLPSQRTSVTATTQTQKCPVCFAFEGDEPAVDHHMSKAHAMH